MPEMDGFEATQQIRKQEKEKGKRRIPIIALTAYAIAGDDNRCYEAGMDGYLTKPINRKLLLETLKQHVGAKMEAISVAVQKSPNVPV